MTRRRSEGQFPSFDTDRKSDETWFSRNGFVLRLEGRVTVLVGSQIIASFEESDSAQRNLVMAMLAQDPQVNLRALADGLGVSTETLRLVRRLFRDDGPQAVMARSRGGSAPRVTPAVRKKLEAFFDQGLTIEQVVETVGKKFGIKRAAVGKVRRQWKLERAAASPASPPAEEQAAADVQPELPFRVEAPAASPAPAQPSASLPPAPPAPEPVTDEGEIRAAPPVSSEYRVRAPTIQESNDSVDPRQPKSARFVQFAGSWLMVAMLARTSLYALAETLRPPTQKPETLRVALDAVTIAFATAAKCVEGVRRLATSTGAALLLTASVPSPNWTRRVLGSFCAEGRGDLFQLKSGTDLIRRAAKADRAAGRPVVFYVDNHGRPYTGQKQLPSIWRMQDRRMRAGASDYHLADDQGQCLLRVTTRQSLAALLAPMALVVKSTLGETERFLFCFDRAGTFPRPMSELRNGGAEFVAWEREPYRRPSVKRLLEEGKEVEFGDERFRVLEGPRANLGKGRGRVRRIWVLTPEKRVVDVLSNSQEDPVWLVEVMLRRWVQENGFKHGVERWGFNQLDGRQVEPVPDETIIVNPERRALDREIERAREREGRLLCELTRLGRGEAEKRTELKAEIARLVKQQERGEARRGLQPKRIELGKTSLAGELVEHSTEYKAMLDTFRTGCVHAEGELASMLAPHLKRPREGKRAVQNLCQAPGSIRVGKKRITLRLDPAGTPDELAAFARLFKQLDRMRLVHPGDLMRRVLRFRLDNAQIE